MKFKNRFPKNYHKMLTHGVGAKNIKRTMELNINITNNNNIQSNNINTYCPPTGIRCSVLIVRFVSFRFVLLFILSIHIRDNYY